MATISDGGGTWTSLSFDRTQPESLKTGPNTRVVDDLNLTAFNSAITRTATPDYPELAQFVTLMAAAHGISYQAAVVLLHHLTAMHVNRGAPQVRDFTP